MTKRKYPNVSIIVSTVNNSRTVERIIKGILRIDYPSKFEVVVINDGSTDDTANVLEKNFGRNKKVKIINLPRSGVCKARNAGIKKSKYEIVVNMDHDCIPKKEWLKKLVSGFDSEKVGVVSSYGYYGGTSTAFRRDLLEKVGGYDEEYFYYREDTDLSFKIMDLGYEFRLVKADYFHDHKLVTPKGSSKIMKYVLKRWKYHMNDVLLYKKHPELAAKFLDIRLGFLIDPLKDFQTATGLWNMGKFALSSPRGIVFLENKSPLHAGIIFFAGLGYLFGVKFYRFLGSIKFRKLLI